MEGTLLVAVLVVAVGAVLFGAWTTRRIRMAIDLPLIPTVVDLDPLLFQRLCTVQGAAVIDAAHGRFTQAIQRVPGWAIVAMVCTFPLGLLFLLVRTERRLTLAVVPTPHGHALRVTGETEVHVWRRTCRALAPLLEHPAVGQPSGSSSWETASS
jgi:hypothetical protein